MTDTITLKGIIDEDFVNYRVPSMVLMFPKCSFKCGTNFCQNSSLVKAENVEVQLSRLFGRYINNPITNSVVLQGLEPFDSWDELFSLIKYFRDNDCNDDIVIYTGYDKSEILDMVNDLSIFHNLIIKYGRYIPNQKSHFDDILGVRLASDNQYAERLDND